MADPVTYTFYGTTVPVFRNIASSAISTLTAAKTEIANAAEGTFPSESELLDSQIGDMLPFRKQPILLATFQIAAIQRLQLNGSASIPAMDSAFADFDAMIDFFKQLQAVFDAIDAKTWNESAEKPFDVHMAGKLVNVSGLADFTHGFMVPNSYFHLNAMYMLLRSKGFKLGKSVYVETWVSETLKKDFATLRK